jgi:hypothetical protein
MGGGREGSGARLEMRRERLGASLSALHQMELSSRERQVLGPPALQPLLVHALERPEAAVVPVCVL